jgi:pimeloyl-ACP methyl ester carboxylesterase
MSPDLSRRSLLRATGIALTAGIAGCSSRDGETTAQSAQTTTDVTRQSGPSAADSPNVGRFYVGDADAGDGVVDGRAEVVAVRPTAETDRSPVVMVPGLGLSPYIYLTTPDGRSGWVEHFVAAGHPVYVFNPPRNVDSGGLDPAALQRSDSASLSRWSLQRAWPTWGFGPEVGEAYEDVRYPVEAVDQLVASFPAYVSTSGGGGGGGRRSGGDDEQTVTGSRGGQGSGSGAGGGSRFASPREVAALDSLLARVGPAVLLVHSAGGGSGFAVAQSSPNLVERVVAVEPVGCPTDQQTVSRMGGDAPFLGVYGDYVAERGQEGRRSACRTTADLAGETAPESTMLSLPDEGVSGNTHLLMQDDNNGAIADRVLDWIAE